MLLKKNRTLLVLKKRSHNASAFYILIFHILFLIPLSLPVTLVIPKPQSQEEFLALNTQA